MLPKIKDSLFEMLTADLAGGAAASVSVIVQSGTEPQTFWIPESREEPAFLAYSITKTFTAALVLKFCEEGRLSLDDRLARWFPRIDRAEQITIRQLLNHTAGIPDYGGIRAYHDSVRAASLIPWSFERFASETFEKGLCFEPGQGWAYSNPGYMLIIHEGFSFALGQAQLRAWSHGGPGLTLGFAVGTQRPRPRLHCKRISRSRPPRRLRLHDGSHGK